MSGNYEFVEAVGRDAIHVESDLMDQSISGLENRIEALVADLDANQREVAFTEHERLMAKLRALDAEVVA